MGPGRRASVGQAPAASAGPEPSQTPKSPESLLDALDMASAVGASSVHSTLKTIIDEINRSIAAWKLKKAPSPAMLDSLLDMDLLPMLSECAALHCSSRLAITSMLTLASTVASYERGRKGILRIGFTRKVLMFMRLFPKDNDMLTMCCTLRYNLIRPDFSCLCSCLPYFASGMAIPLDWLSFWVMFDTPGDFSLVQAKALEMANTKRSSGSKSAASGSKSAASNGASQIALDKRRQERRKMAETKSSEEARRLSKDPARGQSLGNQAQAAQSGPGAGITDFTGVKDKSPPTSNSASPTLDLNALESETEKYRESVLAEPRKFDADGLPLRRSSLVYLPATGGMVDSALLGTRPEERDARVRGAGQLMGRKPKQAPTSEEWAVPDNPNVNRLQSITGKGGVVAASIEREVVESAKGGPRPGTVSVLLVPAEMGVDETKMSDAERILSATRQRGTKRAVDAEGGEDSEILAAALSSSATGRRGSISGGIVASVKSNPNNAGGSGDPTAIASTNRRMSIDEYYAQGSYRAIPEAMSAEDAEDATKASSKASRESLSPRVPPKHTPGELAYAKEHAQLHGMRRASMEGKDGVIVKAAGGGRRGSVTLEERIAKMRRGSVGDGNIPGAVQ